MLDILDGPKFRFPSRFVSAPRTRTLFSPSSSEIRSLNETTGRTNTLRHMRGHQNKKTASVTSAVHRTESGIFFVIKRSEIPEKASSRIKRTADIKAQSKIRRPRKKKSRTSEASVIICRANGRLMANGCGYIAETYVCVDRFLLKSYEICRTC